MKKTNLCLAGLLMMAVPIVIIACSSGGGSQVPPPPIQQTPINLPRTGQTTSYTANDDGALETGLAWPTPRFTTGTGAESDCITDNLTGLMWPKAPDATTRTWAAAISFANDSTLCGHTDWRLANRKELRSLINYERANTAGWLAEAAQGFNIALTGITWTSTTSTISTSAAVYDMSNGTSTVADKGASHLAWQVRSALSGAPAVLPQTGQKTSYAAGDDGDLEVGIVLTSARFSVNADTTITDNLTSLVWAPSGNVMMVEDNGWDVDGDNNGSVTFQHALDYVAKLNLDNYLGHVDWRLPNVNELESLRQSEYLAETCGSSPCSGFAQWLASKGFSNVQSSRYWTSTTYALNTNDAWFVGLDGNTANLEKLIISDYSHVWPVRSAP